MLSQNKKKLSDGFRIFLYVITMSAVSMSTIALNGCAPGLGKDLRVNFNAPVDADIDTSSSPLNLSLIVKNFKDSRPDNSIGEIDGRKLNPKGDIGLSVQSVFYKHLKAAGIKSVMYDAAYIEGEVLDWKVRVSPGFPFTKIEGASSINVTLYNKMSQPIYKSNYTGNYKLMDPFPSERKVERTLSLAMGESVRQAVEDKALINKISQ